MTNYNITRTPLCFRLLLLVWTGAKVSIGQRLFISENAAFPSGERHLQGMNDSVVFNNNDKGPKGDWDHGKNENGDDHRFPKDDKPMFGTKNGYDTGGTDPLCWESAYTVNDSIVYNETNEIEITNERLYQSGERPYLMMSCFEGTEFTIQPLDIGDDMEMWTGKPYTFELKLQLNLTAIQPDFPVATLNGVMDIYFRLHLCDALRQGFCNPLKDTRVRDASLTREEADVDNGSTSLEFTNDENKWQYTEGTILRGLSDQDDPTKSHIYGRWCQWKFRQVNDTSIFRTEVNITIQLPELSDRGVLGRSPYFFVGHAVVGVNTSANFTRVDVTQTTPQKVVYAKPKPLVFTVSKSAKIALGTAIGIVGSFALFCFAVIVVYREHPVMKLAQGSFLAAMAASCLVQTAFSFTFLPTHDIHCKLRGPLVWVPLTLVGAILVGRVWRVYSTLSTVNSLGRNNTTAKSSLEFAFVGFLDFLAGLPTCFGMFQRNRSSTKKRRGSIRRVVTPFETSCLIFMLTLPQIIVQVIGSTMLNAALEINYDPMRIIGREMCGNDDNWSEKTGTGIASFVYLVAVMMAWFSRDLPSAFNEKDQIFNAATICTVISVMTTVFSKVVDQPTTKPDVFVFLYGCVSLGVALAILILIVWPKVLRVRSGEKVVVSNMLGSKFGRRATSETSTLTPHDDHDMTTVHPVPGDTLTPTEKVQSCCWRENEALPKHIEQQIYDLQAFFRTVTHRCDDGRTLCKDEWIRLRDEIAKLKAGFDRVELLCNGGGETQVPGRCYI